MDRIRGVLDSFSEVAAQGWVANLDHPERLELIVCSGADGESVAFSATAPRPDVNDALGIMGRFGFAVPTAALRHLGPAIRFTLSNGEKLAGGEMVAMPDVYAGAKESGEPTRFVIHIPKTAGTSFRTALAAQIAQGEGVFLYTDGLHGVHPDELGALPLHQRLGLRWLFGHANSDVANCLPRPVEFITVLRAPLARLRSNYYHHISDGSDFQFDGVSRNLSEVVQGGMIDEFDNLMTRMIAGRSNRQVPAGGIREEHVEAAVQLIRTRFRFVALTERLDDHYPVLCRALGWPPHRLAIENTRRIEDVAAADAKVDWTEVMHRNRFDVMLYERVQAEGLCGRDLRPSGPASELWASPLGTAGSRAEIGA